MSRRSYHGYEKNEPRTLTVSYRRHDDRLIVSRVGFGRSRDECLQHADEQLPPGVWTRIAISSPYSILNDLNNDGREAKSKWVRNHKGEGAIVTVPALRVRDA